LETLETRLVPATPTTPGQAFVNKAFSDLLGHPADDTSLAVLGALVDAGAPRSLIALGIQQTLEYRALTVEHEYQLFFHRDVDPVGLSLGLNLLNSGGNALELDFLLATSPEYFFRNGSTNLGFLTDVYDDVLGQPLDATSQQGWTDVFNLGVSREEVAGLIIPDLESYRHQVTLVYEQDLGRDPDTQGRDFWVGVAQQFGVDVARAGIIGSDEYFQLAASALTPTPAQPTQPTQPSNGNPITPTVTITGETQDQLNIPVNDGGVTFASERVNLVATVSPNTSGSVTATGTVTFTVTASGGISRSFTAPLGANGIAAVQTGTLSLRNSTVVATYTPDANSASTFNSATSAPRNLVIIDDPDDVGMETDPSVNGHFDMSTDGFVLQ
jgi:hypothetical protein